MVIAKTLEIEQNFKQRRQGPILKQTPLDIKENKLNSKITEQIHKHYECVSFEYQVQFERLKVQY